MKQLQQDKIFITIHVSKLCSFLNHLFKSVFISSLLQRSSKLTQMSPRLTIFSWDLPNFSNFRFLKLQDSLKFSEMSSRVIKQNNTCVPFFITCDKNVFPSSYHVSKLCSLPIYLFPSYLPVSKLGSLFTYQCQSCVLC